MTQGQEIVIDDINNNFSLASLDIVLSRTYTVSVPIQQQLTSAENISAASQDEIILQVGRGVSTAPLTPTVRPVPTQNTGTPGEQIPPTPRLG